MRAERARSAAQASSGERLAGVRLEPADAVAGLAPMDVAEAFLDLPGLALLESGRPGRRARWTFLTADPLAILEERVEGGAEGRAQRWAARASGAATADPFAEARQLLARLDPRPPDPEGDGSRAAGPAALPPFLGGLVGYLGYDFGRLFERLPSIALADSRLPDLHLALHDWVVAWDRRTGRTWIGGRAFDGDDGRLDRRLAEVRDRLATAAAAAPEAAGLAGMAAIAGQDQRAGAGAGARGRRTERPAAKPEGDLRFVSTPGRQAFERGVETIREAIATGEIYQANLTRRLETPFGGDPWPLYRRLRTGDPALFAAYLALGNPPTPGSSVGGGAHRAIISASPEPFLAVAADGTVATDPIKGTRPRGNDPAADRALAAELLASAKDRAENVMIVDVLRNDLGRVCVPGSVRVPRLCRIERTATVQHLVSTVTGRLAPGRDSLDLLAASFPGGSITGAPKIRAMEIIETLEPVRRGPYTGALCWLGPDGQLGSSILIRTFVADGRRLTLGVGGGITRRSDPAAEWEETVVKAAGPLGAIGAREVAG